MLTRPALADVLTVVNDLLVDHASPEARAFAACLQSALIRSYARAERAKADRRINETVRALNARVKALEPDPCTLADDCECASCLDSLAFTL